MKRNMETVKEVLVTNFKLRKSSVKDSVNFMVLQRF
jgi:hypothetical protein